jgi:uncharacterized membrane protein
MALRATKYDGRDWSATYQDPPLIGTIPGMSVVVVILALVLFYWIIRNAVRDGMHDAWKRRDRETGRAEDDTHG